MKPRFAYALVLLVVAQTTASNQVFGQVVVPGQSSQLPPAPGSQKSIPDIRIERRGAEPETAPTGPAILVNSLHITGETKFSESQLIAATGFIPGRELSLSDLRHMALQITEFYNARGYIVAQAYVPAQDIKDGAVTIAVIEGHYGAVKLHNESRLHDGVARGVLRDLDTGDLIDAAPLGRTLLLLSDIPGVEVRSTLSPGSEVGTSDLTVDLADGPRVTAVLEADNVGNPYTGTYQGGGSVNFNEPLGIGDVASLRVLTSGSGMQYVRGSYQSQVGDGNVGAAYAYFHYRLGRQFAVLHADGWEQTASVFGSYPLIRSYDDNLHALIEADNRIFQDKIAATASVSDRRTNSVTLGLAGNHHDTFGGDGWDLYSISVTAGNLDIKTPLVRATDAATVRTAGGYEKLRMSVDRLQTVSGPFSIYGSIRGQLASKNLDISEKMELGGAYAVRAYPEGEAYGDEGYVATVEARLWLPEPFEDFPGRTQLLGFFDTGAVRFNKNPFFAGSNSATRSGAGVGLAWADNNNFGLKLTYAHVVGVPATSVPGDTSQFWFELVKFF